ncbi:MAG: dienelactone hydrolase family protein, partial [Candidatus Neoclostridium sp.]
MKRKIISIIVLLVVLTMLSACNVAIAPDDNAPPKDLPDTPVEESVLTEGSNGVFEYLLYTPENADENTPLIVYLHGSSSHGDDLSLLIKGDDLPKLLLQGEVDYVPAYILFPQLGSEYKDWISVGQQLTELIDGFVRDHKADADRVSLTGFSMGGTGTWNIAASYADTFSCIAPLSGGIRTTDSNLSKLKNLKIRAFVGSADEKIDPALSVQFVQAFVEAGGDATVTVFDGASHAEVPALTFKDEEIGVPQWLCSVVRKTETPEEGGGIETPEEGGGIETPEEGGETETPEEGGETETPEEGGEAETPEED